MGNSHLGHNRSWQHATREGLAKNLAELLVQTSDAQVLEVKLGLQEIRRRARALSRQLDVSVFGFLPGHRSDTFDQLTFS